MPKNTSKHQTYVDPYLGPTLENMLKALSFYMAMCVSHCFHSIKVLPLKDLLRSFENAGEIGVGIALHWVDGESATKAVTRSKSCCFVLDAPKEKTLQKKAGFVQIPWIYIKCCFWKPFVQNPWMNLQIPANLKVGSAPTFGARLNMAKVRNSTNFKICWRMKCFGID